MAWRLGCLLVSVLAWASGGVSHPPSPPGGSLRCDVEALRCDVICSFPDLGLHCNRCARRPMRFGKRGSSTSTQVVDMPTTSQNFAADGGDPRPTSLAAANLLPDRTDSADGLHLVGRPHFFLSKIFWRNRVGQNFPASQERKVQPWRERKWCLLNAQDPSRCPPESVFRKLLRIVEDHGSRKEEKSIDNLCDTEPRLCSLRSDTSGNRLNTIKSSMTHSPDILEFEDDDLGEISRRKRLNSIDTSGIFKSNDYSEYTNSMNIPREHSLNSRDSDTNVLRFNNLENLKQRPISSDEVDMDLSDIDGSKPPSLDSNYFDKDPRSKVTPINHTLKFNKGRRDNKNTKARWRDVNEPAKRFSPEKINVNAEKVQDTQELNADRRRRSRRSVVEEVVEGLMEMLDLEVLPVNPKHYGCHDLPFPGLD